MSMRGVVLCFGRAKVHGAQNLFRRPAGKHVLPALAHSCADPQCERPPRERDCDSPKTEKQGRETRPRNETGQRASAKARAELHVTATPHAHYPSSGPAREAFLDSRVTAA